MGIVGLVVLYPMVFILGASFSSAKALPSGSVWLWPVHLTFDGYSGLWRTGPVPQALGYSVLYTMGGTSLTLMLTIAMAYPLSRRDFFGRRLLARALAPLFAMISLLLDGDCRRGLQHDHGVNGIGRI